MLDLRLPNISIRKTFYKPINSLKETHYRNKKENSGFYILLANIMAIFKV